MKSTLFFLTALFLISPFSSYCSSNGKEPEDGKSTEQLYIKGDELKFEKLKLQASQKMKQECWEPDTIYYFYTKTSIPDNRVIQKYNSQGLLAVSIDQSQGINSWENFSLVTYTYDSNNNLLTELQQSWKTDSWVNVVQTTCTYDSNNNKLTEQQQSWKNNSLEDSVSYIYTYDSNNNLQTELMQRWINNSLLSSLITYYTYDSNNILQNELRQSLENSVWKNFSLITYTYDSDNNLQSYLYQIWDSDSNAWANSAPITYTYDLNGNLLTKQTLMNSLFTYTYDADNNLLTELRQEWGDNNLWENTSLNTYTYDANNNLLIKLAQRWKSNSWENSTQYQWTYDENSNGISAESWKWINESWQPSDNSIYSFVTIILYYNNMQSISEGWGCDKMTASYIKVGAATGIKNVPTALPIQIYSSGKTIQINNRTGKNAIVTVYRSDGVKVAEQTTVNQTTTMKMPVSGIYLVSVRAGNEKPVTKKLIVR